jgi:hypothetical protein
MTDWIEQAKQRIEEDRERERKELEALSLKRQIVWEQAPKLFDSVREAVKTDVERFNRHYSQYNEKLSDLQLIGPKKFQVRRAYDPSFRLEVEFTDSPIEIRYTVEAPNIVDGKIYAYSDKFSFHLNVAAETVSLVKGREVMLPEDISKEMLLPAIRGFM